MMEKKCVDVTRKDQTRGATGIAPDANLVQVVRSTVGLYLYLVEQRWGGMIMNLSKSCMKIALRITSTRKTKTGCSLSTLQHKFMNLAVMESADLRTIHSCTYTTALKLA